VITKQRQLFYFVGETPFKSLEEAQQCDLIKLMPDGLFSDSKPLGIEEKETIAGWLMKNAEAIIDTLSTTPTSRLKARKSHGATRKPRKAKGTPPVAPA
jgi:hypothetical protein